MGPLRLKKDALELQDQQAWYLGKLFDGIAYTLSGDVVTAIEAYEQGICTGPYQDPFFAVPEETPRLQLACLTAMHPDYPEPYTYQGTYYNGLAYRFNGDFCVGQYRMEDGESNQTMIWLENGRLIEYEHYRDTFLDHAHFAVGGQLRQLQLSMKEHFSLELKLDEAEALKTLILTGDFFTQAPLVANEFFTFPLQTPEDLSQWQPASRLYLSGDAIDDRVLSQLQRQSGFQKIQNLVLSKTSVSATQLLKLVSSRHLNQLDVVEKENQLQDALKQLKARRPDLMIEYQHQPLT